MFSIFSSKSVVLDYSISHLVFGIPQETFYLIVIVIAIVIAIIAVFIALSRLKTTSQPS